VLDHLKQTGNVSDLRPDVVGFQEFFDLLGMQEMKELDARYASSDVGRLNY
jgi:hypothetical protein